MDTATRTEKLETDIDRLIERRDKRRRQREGQRDEEALWMAGVRLYEQRQRTQTLWEKLRHHEAMMRRHTATYECIIGRHRLEVERCERALGIDAKENAA